MTVDLEYKVLVVVDPAEESHPAVERIVKLLDEKVEDYKPEVVLLLAFDQSRNYSDDDQVITCREGSFIEKLVTPLQERGVNVSYHISWDKDWADSIIASADDVDASCIMLSHPGEGVSKTLTNEFWYLIRNSHVPVAIIQPNRTPAFNKVLMAIDLVDQKLEGLNQRIYRLGKSISEVHNAELHLACAYVESVERPDRGKLVSLTGIPNDRVHFRMGDPDVVLPETVASVDPDLVLVGASRRTGMKATLRGRKISSMFGKIKRDIFCRCLIRWTLISNFYKSSNISSFVLWSAIPNG